MMRTSDDRHPKTSARPASDAGKHPVTARAVEPRAHQQPPTGSSVKLAALPSIDRSITGAPTAPSRVQTSAAADQPLVVEVMREGERRPSGTGASLRAACTVPSSRHWPRASRSLSSPTRRRIRPALAETSISPSILPNHRCGRRPRSVQRERRQTSTARQRGHRARVGVDGDVTRLIRRLRHPPILAAATEPTRVP